MLMWLEMAPDTESHAQILEAIRRLHIPFYEEARLYWPQARADDYFGGMNEYRPYMQDVLSRLIEIYGP